MRTLSCQTWVTRIPWSTEVSLSIRSLILSSIEDTDETLRLEDLLDGTREENWRRKAISSTGSLKKARQAYSQTRKRISGRKKRKRIIKTFQRATLPRSRLAIIKVLWDWCWLPLSLNLKTSDGWKMQVLWMILESTRDSALKRKWEKIWWILQHTESTRTNNFTTWIRSFIRIIGKGSMMWMRTQIMYQQRRYFKEDFEQRNH